MFGHGRGLFGLFILYIDFGRIKKKMVNEQDIRAIETMAYCGSDVQKLRRMFPDVDSEIITEIWERINKKKMDFEEIKQPAISCNCS